MRSTPLGTAVPKAGIVSQRAARRQLRRSTRHPHHGLGTQGASHYSGLTWKHPRDSARLQRVFEPHHDVCVATPIAMSQFGEAVAWIGDAWHRSTMPELP